MKLIPLTHDKSIPVVERVAQGINYLKEEMANPTPERWGPGGGPINSGYIQQSIIGTIGHVAADAPYVLRSHRNKAQSSLLRDRLTVALGMTGAQDTIPDLLRIARDDPEGSIRLEAVIILGTFARPPAPTDIPKRLRPGEIYRPLSAQTVSAITDALMARLNDPFKRYRVPRREPTQAYFPIQEYAAGGLGMFGYRVQATEQGWRVLNSKGRLVRAVTFNRGKAPNPATRPRGIHQ